VNGSGNRDRIETRVGKRKEANRNNTGIRDQVLRFPFLYFVLEMPGTPQKVRGGSASLPDSRRGKAGTWVLRLGQSSVTVAVEIQLQGNF